jgi:hypothetical protein
MQPGRRVVHKEPLEATCAFYRGIRAPGAASESADHLFDR